jgi:hypothetical protein
MWRKAGFRQYCTSIFPLGRITAAGDGKAEGKAHLEQGFKFQKDSLGLRRPGPAPRFCLLSGFCYFLPRSMSTPSVFLLSSPLHVFISDMKLPASPTRGPIPKWNNKHVRIRVTESHHVNIACVDADVASHKMYNTKEETYDFH